MQIKVIKRDNQEEFFDITKIENVLRVAGLEDEKIKHLIDHINTWLTSLKKDKIFSTEIRDEILLQLHSLDEYVEGLYRWYEKTKDPKQ